MTETLNGYEAKAEHFAEEARKASAALDRVRAIHEPIEALNVRYGHKQKVCTGCGTDDGNWQVWPCPTIRAIEARS